MKTKKTNKQFKVGNLLIYTDDDKEPRSVEILLEIDKGNFRTFSFSTKTFHIDDDFSCYLKIR